MVQITHNKCLMTQRLLWIPIMANMTGEKAKGKNMRERRSKGFTLLELMVVIAIMMILMVLSLPSLRGILDGQRQQENLIHMGQVLEQAQLAAQTRNTYVWVGIASQNSGGAPLMSGGVPVTLVTVVGGLTGSSGDLVNSATVPNATAMLLLPSQVFRNASCSPTNGSSLIDASQINAYKNTNAPAVATASGIFATSSDAGTSPLGITFTQNWQGQHITFSNVIQFNSMGQPMVNAASSNWIELLLGPSVGATVANSSGLLLSGLTGKITLIP